MPRFSSLLSRRLLAAVLAPLALLGAVGCSDDPFIGDDYHVVRDSPGYLRAAYVYANKDGATDADANFRAGDYRLRSLLSFDEHNFGEHYPGCGPGVGEHYARRYGTLRLPKTGGPVGIEAQEHYRDIAWNYAAAYNHEIVARLGATDAHGRGGRTVLLDK